MAEEIIKQYQSHIERELDRRLPAADLYPVDLHRAMRYAVLDGGKRIRPILVYSAGRVVGAPFKSLDGLACAVEFIHAYSLIHDDLPAMDNDDLRHGRPSCHRAFGEALAILAGDALQALAFQLLGQDVTIISNPTVRLQMLCILARAVGSLGMVGGQAVDLAAVDHELTLAELDSMHIHKTGALIRASVLLGALSQPQLEQSFLERLDHYAKCIGLAFQIRDDILNVIGDSIALGKSTGSDRALCKPTYPTLLGLDGSREHTKLLCQDALASLDIFGSEAEQLRWIARFIIERTY